MSRECLTDKQHKYVTIYCDYFCKEGSTDENERMCKGVDLGKVLHNTPINSKHPKKVFIKPTFLKYICLLNFIYHPVILFSQNHSVLWSNLYLPNIDMYYIWVSVKSLSHYIQAFGNFFKLVSVTRLCLSGFVNNYSWIC